MKTEGYKSIPSRFDQLAGNIFHECAVYKIYIPSEMINYYLPNKLLAFSAHTRRNPMRRFFFFSKQAAVATRTQFDDYIDQIPNSVSFNYFLQKLSREKNSKIRYNLVIMDDYLILIRVPYFLDRPYRALCKHITISSRAKYVRFAGEIWCDEYNQFLVNNNSGTYRPSDLLINQVVQMFKNLSPNVHFQGITFRISALPSMKQRI